MIAQSQSGTGKTAAFVLAMLSRVNTDLKHPQVGPFNGGLLTTALSGTLPVPHLWASLANWWGGRQDVPVLPRPHYKVNECRKGIQRHLCLAQVCCERWRGCKRIQNQWQHHHWHSGEGEDEGSEYLLFGFYTLQVLDWSLKFRFFDLSKITVFVLDEADVMIATQVGIALEKWRLCTLFQGHQDQSIRIHKNLGPYCQMLLFSATYDQVIACNLLICNPHA